MKMQFNKGNICYFCRNANSVISDVCRNCKNESNFSLPVTELPFDPCTACKHLHVIWNKNPCKACIASKLNGFVLAVLPVTVTFSD